MHLVVLFVKFIYLDDLFEMHQELTTEDWTRMGLYALSISCGGFWCPLPGLLMWLLLDAAIHLRRAQGCCAMRAVRSQAALHSAIPTSQLHDGGHDEEWDDKELAAKWECMICRCVVRDAVAPRCCGEFFCEICWHACQKRETRCPNCRQEDQVADPANKDRKEVKNLNIRCPAGCGMTMRLGDKDKHLAEECSNRKIKCPACEDLVLATNLEEHRATDCAANFHNCRLCGERVRNDAMEAHFEASGGFVGKHMVAMLALFDEVDRLREQVNGKAPSTETQRTSSSAPRRMWHPGRILPQPNGLNRIDGRGTQFRDGYDFDTYALNWVESLDIVFPKGHNSIRGDNKLSRWSCCDGVHDAPGCQAR